MMKLLGLTITFLVTVSLHAQSDTILKQSQVTQKNKKISRTQKAKYLNFELFVGQTNAQDYAVSPLQFKGSNFGAGLCYYNRGEDSEWSVNTLATNSFMKNEYSGSKTQFVSGTINAYYLRNSKKLTGKKIRTYLGGYLLGNGNVRINPSYFNTSYIYDIISSIGISGKINSGFDFKTKAFTWNNQGTEGREKYISLDYQLSIPLLHIYNRPGYATIDNFASTENTNARETKINTWGKTARLTSKVDLTLFLKNNNALRISYYWDAYSASPNYNKLAVSNTGFLMTLMFRLNKKILE